MSLFALPVTVSDLTTLQQGITFATDTAAATAEAAQINNGAHTVYSYAVRLINSQISGSQVAMAVDSLMFGVTDNLAELSKLTNSFLPAQAANAVKNGFNPTVYAAEFLGLALAGGNGTSNNFATTFGARNIQDFATSVSAVTGTNADQIVKFVNNWIAFYTANPGALHGLSVTLASYGAAFGDAVGVALLNPEPIGPLNQPDGLPDARFNFVQNDVYNALKDIAEGQYVVGVDISALPPETPLQGEGPAPGTFFTLTPGQDTFVGRVAGGATFFGPLNTLTSADNLTAFGPNNLLQAFFEGNHTAASVNIRGIQTWDITQTAAGTQDDFDRGIITITGDAPGGPHIIEGLRVVNFHDDTTDGSLLIGNNLQPVETVADGFQINVDDAIGNGFYGYDSDGFPLYFFESPGVDVDIWAKGFTGHDTIFVTANVVGGFPLHNGSLIIPPEILIAPYDGDDYDPNWIGYLSDAFAIAAGSSRTAQADAVGFANWDVTSTGANLNIIALGGEGSTSAQTITLHDDGSNTMLFATALSDSLSSDWKNVTKIDLTKTSGFVTLTGLETDVAGIGLEEELQIAGTVSDGSSGHKQPLFNFNPTDFSASNFAAAFQFYDGGGLLTSNTGALTSIAGGTGNSMYDLSSLTPAAAHAATSIDGGHGTAGNSEVAFNNAVFTSGLTVNISHIQILDDVSSLGQLTVPIDFTGGTATLPGGGEAQGGIINLANFAVGTGWTPLNVPYALLAQDLGQGGEGARAPFGLPFTELPAGITSSTPIGVDLQAGVVPAGFTLFQLLNAEGSTQTVLGAKLIIENAPVNFAINMQDTGDGFITEKETGSGSAEVETHTWNGFDITVVGQQGANVNTGSTLVMFVSDDGATLEGLDFEGDSDGDPIGTAMYVPEFTVFNYSTLDIVLPTESVGEGKDTQNYTILGGQDPLAPAPSPGQGLLGPGFDFEPVPTVQNAVVNFFDNNADNGGSPPGGETNLVLGFTNFTGTLAPVDIGVTSVLIDTRPLDFSATINDFGTGSLEIGATNATNLNAQSTSHLIMDLPGSLDGNGNGGIVVNGSLTGQNLLQGTSGLVLPDPNGHNPSPEFGLRDGEPAEALLLQNGVIIQTGTDYATVLEAQVQHGGTNGGWGNDTLTGGNGFGGVSNEWVDQSFLNGVNSEPGPGNSGDNFFPEGGTDIVNIAAGEVGTLTSSQEVDSSSGSVLIPAGTPYANYSTVWVGFYDICNSAGPNAGAPAEGFDPFVLNSGVGTIYDQAITDINPTTGEETFVDGYGAVGFDANDPAHPTSSPAVTINGFHFANQTKDPSTLGDTIVFGVQSWASGEGTIDDPTDDDDFTGLILGLVDSTGSTTVPHEQNAVFGNVGTAGGFVERELGRPGAFTVITDSIAPFYASAQQLQNALNQKGAGDFNLNGPGVAGGTEVDILVAYSQQTAPGVTNITIADVTLTNTGSAGSDFLTNTADLHATVHDLVHISTTGTPGVIGLSDLGPHNVYFMA